MNATFTPYRPQPDFIRVRDMLVETVCAFEQPVNWRLERWNYARYFVSPMLGTSGVDPDPAGAEAGINRWERSVGLWEDGAGQIVGLVTKEHAEPSHSSFSEAFLMRRPGWEHILPEMLAYAETRLANPLGGSFQIYLYDYDHAARQAAQDRGFAPTDWHGFDSVLKVGKLPRLKLPRGFRLQSMAEANEIDRRRKAFGLGFNHPDPNDWPSDLAYKELQRAPDYRRELDLSIVDAEGEHAAVCIIWMDDYNKLATLEPVATIPKYRNLGLGSLVVTAAVRRVAELGATEIHVGSGQPFYIKLGFQRQFRNDVWSKHLSPRAA